MKWQILPIGDFERCAAGWDSINDAGPKSPILTSRFLAAALAAFGTGREVIACLGSPDAPQAMSLFKPRKTGVWDTFQPAQAPIGFWLSRPDLDMADALGGLIRALPGFPLLLGVTQQDPEILPRPAERSSIATLDYIQTPRIDTRCGFEEYWNQRGKNLRQNVRKASNKLERAGLSARLLCLTEPEQVKDAVEHYGRLESAGWKSQGGTAVSMDNPQGRFYTELLEAYCRAGQGRVYQFLIDDKIVAMDLCIGYGPVLVILKTSYDESMAEFSPAMLMHYGIFQELFADEAIERIEFYGKFMEWHRRWTEDCRVMFHINAYRWEGMRRLLEWRDGLGKNHGDPKP